MKKIKLTRGQFALVDDEDFEELNKHKWNAIWDRTTGSFYAVRTIWIVPKTRIQRGKSTSLKMHRVIMGAPKGKTVDHINRKTLDNRKENLRICSYKENSRNQGIRKNNSSGYKGVYLDKKSNKWKAYVRVNYKSKHLGTFVKKEEAAEAYNKAAIKYFGEFAVLNKIN